LAAQAVDAPAELDPGTAAVLVGTKRSPPPSRTPTMITLTKGCPRKARGTILRTAAIPVSIFNMLAIPLLQSNLTWSNPSSEGAGNAAGDDQFESAAQEMTMK
jgi:hypothetical protein